MSRNRLTNAFQMILGSQRPESIVRKRLKNKAYITDVKLFVLGTGTKRSPPCLALCVRRSHNNNSYYFNLTPRRTIGKPEGKTTKRAVFYTTLSWSRLAHGISLFMENSFKLSETNINIIGPPGLKTYLQRVYMYLLSKRRFHAVENSMAFDEDSELDYVDNNLSMKKIFVTPESAHADFSLGSISLSTAVYICKLNDDTKPIWNWEKLGFPLSGSRQEGDKKREFIRRLESGLPVKHYVTGEEINPKDYSTRSSPPTFIVMECPTIDHFKIISEHKIISSYFDNETQTPPCVVAHITPAKLFSSAEYQNWLEKFGRSCHHLILNEDSKNSHSLHEFSQQYAYHNLCSEFFPKPHPDFLKDDMLTVPVAEENKTWVDLSTKYKVSDNEISKLNNEYYEVFKNMKHSDNMMALNDDVIGPRKSEISELVESGNFKEYPKLCVLGCGGNSTTKYRTQPGFLLLLDRERSVLMECGEHSLLRIHQQFGNEVERILSTIRCIFISHCHLDHNIGFLPLLQEVVEARQNSRHDHNDSKVCCLMPDDVRDFYEDYCRDYLPSLLDQVSFFSVHDVRQIREKREEILPAIKAATGLRTIWPVPVKHGVQTFGLKLITDCNIKIIYSSDTLPSQKHLIWEGQEADLLIHDCLYVNQEWEEEAYFRKHSSLKGALETSSDMRAKFTLLTHFTGSCPAVPLISTEDLPEKFHNKVACAYDYLHVSLSMLHLLPKLEPILVSYYEQSLSRFRKNLDDAKERQRKRMDTVNSLLKVIEK